MRIEVPESCLIVLIGASGSGKSSFGRKHFLPTEVVSSDFCRGLIMDDENDLTINTEAFDLLHHLIDVRLKKMRLTVVDATNVQPQSRKALLEVARRNDMLVVGIVFNIREEICRERNETRSDRNLGPHVIRNQIREMKRGLGGLRKEGFRYVHFLNDPEAVDAVVIERAKVWNNLKHETGPFDIIGDIHGCYEELVELLAKLEYKVVDDFEVTPPEGRRAIFLGDLVDRGPDSPSVLKLVMRMVREGKAFCVPGNHDAKLLRALSGAQVKVSHGLGETLEQLEKESVEFKAELVSFLDSLVGHYVLNGGDLVVAHAGMRAEYQGRTSARIREFALYGETTGETDEFGLPVRFNWAAEYRGSAMVVYGHTPVPEAEWLNRTICLDTGCVFGGKLTALRYPERELVSVGAKMIYSEPIRPIAFERGLSAQMAADDVLDIAEVAGRRHIHARLVSGTITLREENATAALEIMSRFAVDPRWLVYLPPTMSPSETSSRDGFLEYPDEAFAYFEKSGVAQVICEEKHMGSRSVVVVCRDAETAHRRLGVEGNEIGVITTRTGRRFFDSVPMEQDLLARISKAADESGLWDELQSDWMVLDCELMPWSAKAQELLRRQYAPVGAAANHALGHALEQLSRVDTASTVSSRDENAPDFARIHGDLAARKVMAEQYVSAYRRYCWPVHTLNDYRLAPFHLLASEGAVHTDKDHLWHLAQLAKLAEKDPILLATAHRVVDLADEQSRADASAWWEELVAGGGEGMVIKPMGFLARDAKGMVQPALKCRGPEYLRIIYGPEYLREENIVRLRKRGVAVKRALAMKEFALGIEALHRFVEKEPLRRVHECVFGVLAFESEPVDPRL